MINFSVILAFIHLLGLSLAAGSATVKILLLLRCNKNHGFFPVYFQVTKLVTKLIIAGMILLTLSGIAWIIRGYAFEPLLIFKLVVVAGIWIIGPVIDNVAEPKLKKYYPLPDHGSSPEFIRAQKQHLSLEIVATIMMYVAFISGVLL